MVSRAAAILLAILGLYLSAVQAAAQPRGWGGGRGGWGGGFRGGGYAAGRWGGGGPRGGGFGGRGWGGPRMGGGYPGGYGDRPDGFGGRPAGPGYPGGYGRGGPGGYGGPPFAGGPPVGERSFAPPPRAMPGGQGRAAFDGDWRMQQNEVRQAVREGRHIPLNQAIEAVRRRAPGRELDAGLEPGPDGRSVYRLRWAGQNGRRQDYLVDAGSGAIVGVQGGP